MTSSSPDESVRQQVRARLRDKVPGLSEKDAELLEVGVYNWAIEYCGIYKVVRNWSNPRFVSIYSNKVRSIAANLDPSGYICNLRLRDRLFSGEFTADRLAFLGRDRTFPERWKDFLDIKMRRDEHVLDDKPSAMTDEFVCSRCNKRECHYAEVQARSADEPMSLMIS